MKTMILAILACGAIATASGPKPYAEAPSFSLPASSGKDVSLSEYKGKYVILEWWNHQCPVVGRHYGGNMQAFQKKMKAEDVVWLSICSSAPGKQGYVTVAEAGKVMEKNGGVVTEVLLDPDGKVGKLYNAKTTPQMVLISPKGELLYNGAIDNAPSARTTEEAAKAENWVIKALGQHRKGEAITNPSERPYGCGVKYAQ